MQYIVTTPWWLRMLFPKNLIWEIQVKEKIIYLTFDDGPQTDDELWLNNVKEAAKWIDSDLFRPPYGKIRSFQAQLLQNANPPYRIIMWNVLSADFDTSITPEKCFSYVNKKTKPGSIIVFHDSEKAFPNMCFALTEMMRKFSGEGYRFEAIK